MTIYQGSGIQRRNRPSTAERVLEYLGCGAGLLVLGLTTHLAINAPKISHEPAINEHPHNYQGEWMPHVVESGETVDGILFGTYGLGGYKPCARVDVLEYPRNSGDARIFPNDTLWVPTDMRQHPLDARK